MRFTTAFAATALATTAFAAPATECSSDDSQHWNKGKGGDHHGRPGRMVKHTGGATMNFPATCTAVVTSVQTATVTETATYAPEPTEIDADYEECVTDEEAENMADVFRQLIQDYSDELALNALTEDFVDYASVVNSLMNRGAQYPKNITGPTFDGRQEFMDGQGSQPKIPFTTLNVFHGCRTVTVRWKTERSANGQPTEQAMIPVVGIAAMELVPAEPENEQYNWRIEALYSEFNSLAWAVNLGLFTPAGPVDYINGTNTTTTMDKRSLDNFDPSLRGPAI
ncbi:hypothetical protein KC332_g3692 [Hortaea werneckii]|uniref:NTF2-like domain-containing protein n=2 Tax=Hortaea werneckii TaxID=91943 RepID=A0A3M7GLF0_HORWE|nr:hypothetical protein KC358_g3702 [Hortaea werneckii]OTA22252.1 hypothetical protein BTJ68_14821 [Hortaea werneckii EXF-2000]KAI6847204.1 hypothetical protein KC350_g3569 [Hortaea werneckii]KAI6925808.1 hypothetical protein KC341_g13169 [Hortaea werneckii]KAI6944492.1 hypothetical protein KC348_g3976 [Hortaea werneckii]